MFRRSWRDSSLMQHSINEKCRMTAVYCTTLNPCLSKIVCQDLICLLCAFILLLSCLYLSFIFPLSCLYTQSMLDYTPQQDILIYFNLIHVQSTLAKPLLVWVKASVPANVVQTGRNYCLFVRLQVTLW